MFRGKPLPRATVELIGPPGWSKTLRTDAAGRVALALPWAGRYVAEVQHVADETGTSRDTTYDRVRYVTTLSFVTETGIPWTPGS